MRRIRVIGIIILGNISLVAIAVIYYFTNMDLQRGGIDCYLPTRALSDILR